MDMIDIAAIERRARQLRAEEIRRIEGLFAAQMRVLGYLLATIVFAGVLAVAGVLRAPLARLSRSLRALVPWNPEVHHHL